MGKLRSLNQKDRMEAQLLGRKTLYEDIATIPVYKYYRDNLRPWDRQLPPIVEQEANRRDLWVLKPPSGLQIFAMMIVCLAIYQVIALVPVFINYTHIQYAWRDTSKPAVVYYDPRVLFACWVVSHICVGLALWFVWLAEGFAKHALELFPMLIFSMAECVWFDVLFYTKRLDWLMATWCFILLFVVVSQFLLAYKGVGIATLFLIPHVIVCIVIIVYIRAFMNYFPDMVWYSYGVGN